MIIKLIRIGHISNVWFNWPFRCVFDQGSLELWGFPLSKLFDCSKQYTRQIQLIFFSVGRALHTEPHITWIYCICISSVKVVSILKLTVGDSNRIQYRESNYFHANTSKSCVALLRSTNYVPVKLTEELFPCTMLVTQENSVTLLSTVPLHRQQLLGEMRM